MARKLGRTTDARLALLRNLAADVILHERVEPTAAKATDVRSAVEKMITLGKKGDLNARRQAASFLYNKKLEENEQVLQELFGEHGEGYAGKQRGKTGLIK